jgi:hypothetical protein
MNVEIRMPSRLRSVAMTDLSRPHPFAFERVGFFSAVTSRLGPDHVTVLFTDYHVVPDDHYRDDGDVGASIGSDAICQALDRALSLGRGQFHVHVHNHRGIPRPSSTDREGLPPLVRSLSVADPSEASGYLIFSRDSVWAEVVLEDLGKPTEATKFTSVGFPTRRLL